MNDRDDDLTDEELAEQEEPQGGETYFGGLRWRWDPEVDEWAAIKEEGGSGI